MRSSHRVQLPPPWVQEAVLTKKLFHDGSINGKARFYKYDLWHSFHLGAGKLWLGSGLMLLQLKIPAPNVGERFAILNAAYAEFCRREKLSRIIGKLDQHMCGVTLPEPQGTWSKAAVTSNLCLFVEDYLGHHPELIAGDERLQYFAAQLELSFRFCLSHIVWHLS